MKDFPGKTAVVTGAASGIGLAIVERLVREGMNVVLADVEKPALDRAVAGLRASGRGGRTAAGGEVVGIVTDVSKYESVEALAAETRSRFGNVHVLCNNAGVGAHEDVAIWNLPLSDWRWTFAVNVWGVIHGIKAFVGAMVEHGEDGHVVNTSSGNGGLIVIPTTPIYATSKSAVSTVTEALHYQLVQWGSKIRASVLYPGPHIVASNIFSAARNRPPEHEREVEQVMPPMTLETIVEMASAAGMKLETTQPAEVAEHFFAGLREDRFYILPPSEEGDRRFRERAEATLARRNPQPPRLF